MPTGKKEKLQEKQLKHKTKFATKQVLPFSRLKDSYFRFYAFENRFTALVFSIKGDKKLRRRRAKKVAKSIGILVGEIQFSEDNPSKVPQFIKQIHSQIRL